MLDFLQFDFLIRSLTAGLLIGVTAPAIGLLVVLKRQSFLADALSHVSLLGLALASILQIPLTLGAIVVSVGAAVGMEELRRTGRLFRDSSLVIFFSGSLALAIVIMSLSGGLSGNILSYLFGSIATVTTTDVWVTAGVFLLAFAFLFFFGRSLFLLVLNEDLAQVSGVHIRRLNIAFATITAMIVAVSLQTVGALLVGSLMTVPVFSALQWNFGFRRTLALSIVLSVLSVLIGFVL
ncbi:MAG: metal ABC transporter permease, partial [Candidatus Moraniibacteriota bacterium]